MKTKTKFIIIIAFCLFIGCAGVPKNERIKINKLPRSYEVSVPASKLIVTIPKGRLLQMAPNMSRFSNLGHFYFENKRKKTIVSGWFEPGHKFPGIKTYWDESSKIWSSMSMQPPQDVLFDKIGDWEVITYTRDAGDDNITKSHISAHWVQSGTWIDLNISSISDDPSDKARSKLVELLKTIQVREK